MGFKNMGHNEDDDEEPVNLTTAEKDWIRTLHNHYVVSNGYPKLSKSAKSLQKKISDRNE